MDISKTFLMFILTIGLTIISLTTLGRAQSSGNKASGNATKSSSTATGTGNTPQNDPVTQTSPVGQENFNNTGTTTYNNGTGANTLDTTGTDVNQGTSTSNNNLNNNQKKQNMNAGATTRIKLEGLQSGDASQIIQTAKTAGATNAQIQGNTLIITGDSFKMDRFKSLLAARNPNIDIQ